MEDTISHIEYLTDRFLCAIDRIKWEKIKRIGYAFISRCDDKEKVIEKKRFGCSRRKVGKDHPATLLPKNISPARLGSFCEPVRILPG